MSAFKDITGLVSGFLTAVKLSDTQYLGNNKYWVCACKCPFRHAGHTVVVRGNELARGATTSCIALIHRASDLEKQAWKSYQAAYRDSLRDGRAFTILFDYYLPAVQKACFYCHLLPSVRPRIKHGRVVYVAVHGIDRKIPDFGYVNGNCVTCCWKCNDMKGAMTHEQFIEHLATIAKAQNMTDTKTCIRTRIICTFENADGTSIDVTVLDSPTAPAQLTQTRMFTRTVDEESKRTVFSPGPTTTTLKHVNTKKESVAPKA